MNAFAPHLRPNKVDVQAHLWALFPPAFVHHFPNAQVEVVYGPPNKPLTTSKWFSAFDIETIAGFVEVRSARGDNCYVGAGLRQGPTPKKGRARTENFLAASCAWAEFDGAGDAERIDAILKEKQLQPAFVISTGTTPCLRQHLYFRIRGGITDATALKAVNSALRDLLGSDDVTDAIRIMRLGGCFNYPTNKKRDRGYVAELVTVKVAKQPHEYSAEELIYLSRHDQPHRRNPFDFNNTKRPGRSDDDLLELLQKSRTPQQWHNSMRDVIATMVGRGQSEDEIRILCAPYCDGGKDDPDLDPLIAGARSKGWGKPNGASPDGGSSQDANLPVIQVAGGELSALAVLGEDALISAGVQIYQRGGTLVRPIVETVDATRGRMTNVVRLKALDVTYLRDLLCRHARWVKFDARKKGLVIIDPPEGVAKTILARAGDWTFPEIAGVISAPTMRPDGSLLLEPGYDKQTRLLLASPPQMPPIPDNPTRGDALAALKLLEELVAGFPFVDDVSQAVSLASFLTAVCRGAFSVAPLLANNAPAPGTGKSFHNDIIAAIVIGQPMPVISTGGSEQELEKRLGTALMTGQPLISIDNVTGELGGDALCQITERPIVDIRILGRSEQVRIEARGTTVFTTGNNLIIAGDMGRRTIKANLDAGVERPELRHFDFDPVDRVLANRGKYIAAALTICRAYVVAGRPDKASKLGSFGEWSDTVRSALIWLGKEDPVKSMDETIAADPIREELVDMLEAWSDVFDTGSDTRRRASDVITKAMSMTREHEGAELEPESPELHAAVTAVASRMSRGRSSKPEARTFGQWLQQHKGRVVNGKKFMCAPDAKRGNQWWVENTIKTRFTAMTGELSPEGDLSPAAVTSQVTEPKGKPRF